MLPSFRRHGDLLVAYLSPQRPRVLLLAVLLLASIGLQLVNPQIVSYFIDTAQKGGPMGALTAAAVLFLAIALVQQVVALGATYMGAVVGWEATNRLRADLMRHCLALDLPFHKSHTPGELIERIDGDVNLLANFFSQFTINILGNGLLVAGILVILARNSIWLGLGLTLYCVATALALRAVQRRAVLRQATDRQASAEQYGAIEERLVGTEDIRGVGAEAYVLWRLLGLMQRRLRTLRSANLAANMSYFTTNLLYVVAYAIGLGLGAFLYERHQITLGTAYLIVFYIGMLAAPLAGIRRQVQDMQQATAGIGRIDTLLKTESALSSHGMVSLPDRDAVNGYPTGQGWDAVNSYPTGPDRDAVNGYSTGSALSVSFDGVTFSYEDGESVLRDLFFTLEPGQTLGLLGRTGSGKTTLIRLLARLYDPDAGSIRLDDIDLRDLTPETLRRRIGVVTQDVQFFRATVRDNLTFFRSGIRDADILEVFRVLDLWDWYRSLPNGLDTMLGPGGAGLSAGQAQLLAFARVFLRDPGLVILDEATSRLDPATERTLEHAVDRLLDGRTGIVVAHRLRTVGRVDNIMILENGRIAELGRRVDLLEDPESRFNALLRVGLEEVLA
jgi:ABC-type multidrug transport system fused ATPase/permease subunit